MALDEDRFAEESAAGLQEAVQAVEQQSADDRRERGREYESGSYDVPVPVAGHVENVAEQLDAQREEQRSAAERHQRRRNLLRRAGPQTEDGAQR